MNMNYTKRTVEERTHDEILIHVLTNKSTLRDELNLINEKKSRLSAAMRKFLVENIDEMENEIREKELLEENKIEEESLKEVK